MKIGTVVTIFDQDWKKTFQPLLSHDFDHFELLPENTEAYGVDDLKTFFQSREVILHAPFIEPNLISNSVELRQSSREYLVKRLRPLVEVFHPKVITTHVGSHPFIYQNFELNEFKKLIAEIPECVMENMPGGDNMWKKSYPSMEEECDFVLNELNGKMTFDVGHFMKQDLDVYRLLEKYLPNIVDIHLHDFVDGSDHQELGTGSLDLQRFFRILKKFDYQHYLTIELHHDNVSGMINSLKLVKSYLS